MPCATRVLNNNFGKNFYGNTFWCAQEISQILVTRLLGNWSKRWLKKLSEVRPKTLRRKRKRRKKGRQLQRFLHYMQTQKWKMKFPELFWWNGSDCIKGHLCMKSTTKFWTISLQIVFGERGLLFWSWERTRVVLKT